MKARLGVNIDHVATLRQARGEDYPSVKRAAEVVIDEGGADQITIHLREDRRHIQDFDVFDVRDVTSKRNKLFNLEMACSDEIIEIAGKCNPDWVCLVPEKREERTTEGGLDLYSSANFEKVKNTCEELKKNNAQIKISLFVEANREALEASVDLRADAVEIHTGDFARNFLNKNNFHKDLESFKKGFEFAEQNELHYHAGHGITLEMVPTLLELRIFEEYNIGHWIISEAVFSGLGSVVRSFKNSLLS